jgi:uncharacterized protein YbjT (DUF2867 family)
MNPTSTAGKRLVTVTGATGIQGGAVRFLFPIISLTVPEQEK